MFEHGFLQNLPDETQATLHEGLPIDELIFAVAYELSDVVDDALKQEGIRAMLGESFYNDLRRGSRLLMMLVRE